ncbi:hypothetical protein CFOL_v3_13473 [Cephalotus follicularis]|uniref:Uncharacterized protein n=1 Tax=Cephalotus follicularis TaxID=3775 RepID=A0A1Q3BQ36_CEPFO|nr:hypothetical protein CFOL_v3_13473 [Cephalotus follicularis]
MAKPTNLLGEHRLLYHITTTHILPNSGGHEKMSYQDLYIMWHVVTGKPLNLPHLIMKNMLRATSKVEGALPYGMVITKILKEKELKVKVMRMLKSKEKLKERSKPLHHRCSKVKQVAAARRLRPWILWWII